MDPGVIVVMGVAGSGKSTVAAELARRLGWRFAEGDAFHPAGNVEKMRQGIALNDSDRWPWLDAIAAWVHEARRGGGRCVVACSALKRAYRERIAGERDDVRFVHLAGDHDTIASRLAQRTGHYMPLSLLKSQFDALEPPAPDDAVVVSVDSPPEAVVAKVLRQLSLVPGDTDPHS